MLHRQSGPLSRANSYHNGATALLLLSTHQLTRRYLLWASTLPSTSTSSFLLAYNQLTIPFYGGAYVSYTFIYDFRFCPSTISNFSVGSTQVVIHNPTINPLLFYLTGGIYYVYFIYEPHSLTYSDGHDSVNAPCILSFPSRIRVLQLHERLLQPSYDVMSLINQAHYVSYILRR